MKEFEEFVATTSATIPHLLLEFWYFKLPLRENMSTQCAKKGIKTLVTFGYTDIWKAV